jgi:two-component system C4-dicarboxylate transport sensor histidine kinase DctB
VLGLQFPLADPSPAPEWLERANRLALIARVVSSTVHDVNNALQVISGSAELLEMAPGASEAVLRRGRAIGTQAKRASDLLNELSGFVRDARDRAERVGLHQVASQALAMRHYSLNKLRVTTAVEGDEVWVEANARELLQVLLNLVINAEQAIGETGEARLRVLLAREGQTATLSVEDNGAGVPADAVDTLFDARMTAPGASGDLRIGLGVSRWLAGRMNGTLTHAPADGGGARFVLSLPVSGG